MWGLYISLHPNFRVFQQVNIQIFMIIRILVFIPYLVIMIIACDDHILLWSNYETYDHLMIIFYDHLMMILYDYLIIILWSFMIIYDHSLCYFNTVEVFSCLFPQGFVHHIQFRSPFVSVQLRWFLLGSVVIFFVDSF